MGKFTMKDLLILKGLSIFGIDYLIIKNDLFLLSKNKIEALYIEPQSIELAIKDFIINNLNYDM
jgi:hypothetical protein